MLVRAPASSSARRGSVISTCSNPSATRIATFFPASLLLSMPSSDPVLTTVVRTGDATRMPASGSAALRPPDGSHLCALAASAEEPITAVRLESRDADPGRHLERLEHLARFRIHAPDVALLALPGPVP